MKPRSRELIVRETLATKEQTELIKEAVREEAEREDLTLNNRRRSASFSEVRGKEE